MDLVFTNCPNSVSSVEIVDNLPGTDHDAVQFVVSFIPVASVTQSGPPRLVLVCSWMSFHIFLGIVSLDTDVEYAWACWKDLFFSAVSMTVPTVKLRQSKMKHWFSPETLHLIRVKRRIYRQMKQLMWDRFVEK